MYNAESPFEFRALEVALEAICSYLAARTTELETAAYPALDELTSKVYRLLMLFLLYLCCIYVSLKYMRKCYFVFAGYCFSFSKSDYGYIV